MRSDVKRYDILDAYGGQTVEAPDGEWVRAADAAARIRELEAERDKYLESLKTERAAWVRLKDRWRRCTSSARERKKVQWVELCGRLEETERERDELQRQSDNQRARMSLALSYLDDAMVQSALEVLREQPDEAPPSVVGPAPVDVPQHDGEIDRPEVRR